MADLNVGIRVGARMDGSVRRAVGGAAGYLGRLQRSTEEMQRSLRRVTALRQVTGDLERTRTRARQAAERVARVGAAMRQVRNPTAAMARNLADARAEARRLNESVGEQTRQLGRLRREMRLAGEATDNLEARERRLGRTLERQQRRFDRREGAAQKLRSMRARMFGVAGGVYAAARVVGGAMEREEQAQYLRTVVTGPDRDAAVGRAVGRARDASRTTLASDEEMLNIQYALHSAGFDESAVDAAEERVHKLAKVTRGEANQVGEVFAITFNNMAEGMAGTVEQKMDRIGNVLAKTQFRFQIRDFGQLGDGLKYASSAAVAAKVPFEDTAAVIGQLNSAGMQGSMAGTAFQAMMRTMGRASEKFGFQVVRTKDGTMDLVATLQNFRNATGSDDVRMRIEELVDDADGRISDQDALVQMIQDAVGEEGSRGFSLILPLVDRLVQARRELVEAGQSNLVEEEYERFLKGGAGQWKMLGQNVRQVGEIFANSLLPQITASTRWLARQAGRVSELIERYPWVGRLIGGLALGFGAVTVGATALAAGIWLVNAAMLANPVGAVVALLVAAGAIIYALWDPISEKIEKLWNWLKKVGAAISDTVVGRFVGRLTSGTLFKDDDEEAREEAPAPPGRGRGPRGGAAGSVVRRTAAAAVVAAPIAAGAAPAPEVGDTGPAAAPVPQAGEIAATRAPAPDWDAMQEQAAGIGKSLDAARAGAVAPADDEENADALRRIDAGLAVLNAQREQEEVPLAGDQPSFRAAQPGAVQGASLVFHQTFHFEGAGPEVYDEIERRMEAVMRRASVEAGLVEAEDEL